MPKMTLADATAEIDALSTPMHAPPPQAVIERRAYLVKARWHTKLKWNLIPIDWRERWFVQIGRAKAREEKREAQMRRDRAAARRRLDADQDA